MKTLFATIAVLLLCGAAYSQGGNKVLWVQNFYGTVRDCAFMPDEDFIILAKDDTLQIRKTEDQSLVWSQYMGNIVYSLDVSKDGKFVAIGANTLRLIDLKTMEMIKEFPREAVGSVSISPDGKRIAFTALKRLEPIPDLMRYVKAFVIDIESGEQLFEFGQEKENSIYMGTVKFSPDGKWLACAYRSNEPHIYIFDTDSFKLFGAYRFVDVHEEPSNFSAPSVIYFSPDSKYLISNTPVHYQIRIWDILNKKVLLQKSGFSARSPIIMFNDNQTIFLRASTQSVKSLFYNFVTDAVYELDSDYWLPLADNPTFNQDETLLLGDKLCLARIDKTVLSAPGGHINKTGNGIIIPNPATGDITVKLELPYSDVLKLEIFDEMGKNLGLIHNSMAAQGNFELRHNILYLPIGAYFMRVSQKDYSETIKFVKE